MKRTAAVTSIGHTLHSASDLGFVLDRACVSCISAFAAVKAHVVEYTEEEFLSRSAWELIDGKIRTVDALPSDDIKQTVCQWSLDNSKLASIPEGYDDPRETEKVHQMRRELNRGATVIVPLVHESNTWGVLAIHRNMGAGNFTDHDLNLLNHVGEQISSAIHRCGLMEEVQYRANHDQLTGLPNRSSFELLLKDKIISCSQQGSKFMLLFIDLDGFKAVNDTLGHSVGDKLLTEISDRFRTYFSEHTVLSRIGGDEFGVIIDVQANESGSGDYPTHVLEDVVRLIEQDVVVDETRIAVGASIGVSLYPDNGSDSVTLLRHADIAMYSVKGTAKGGYQIYNDELGALYANRVKVESELVTALKNNELRLFYQPKVDTRTGQVHGVEALIRWQHPDKGLLTPYHFITVAEESGLIIDIGYWVLDEAIRQLGEWDKKNLDIQMAVNIAAPQLADADFAALLLKKLDAGNVSSSMLQLEVTESVVMNDIKSVVMQLKTLQDAGVSIAIDDFGTGYSSLKYLKELPLDVLKIDKSFVDNLSDGEQDRSLAHMIVSIAKSLELATVAEGVETEDQRSIIGELGCDYIQGYLYSKPVSATEIQQVIADINNAAQFQSGQMKRAS